MYEIYSYGNNDALVQVFNGIAALMGSGNYADLIRTVMLISLFAAVIGGLFAARFNGFNWFVGMTFFYMVLFIPKVTVVVVDKLSNQPSVAIANVPIGLGFFAHFTSKIGDFLTTSFETVFSLPDDLKYQSNGVLFGNKLFTKTMSIDVPNVNMRSNFLAFIKSCTYRDIQDLTLDIQTVNTSADTWATLAGTNAGRLVTLPQWPYWPMSCSLAYTILNGNLPFQVADAKQYLGRMVNPHITNPVLAAAALDTQMPSMTQQLLGISKSADLAIKQAFMRNLFAGGGVQLAQQLGDPSATQIALAQAQAENTTNLSGKTLAGIAEEALPMIRNTIEVIAYAVFPIVFLTFLMPMQAAIMALKGYLYTLLWIQLWPPLYAVLNLVVTLEVSRQMTAVTALGRDLSLASIDMLNTTAISTEAIAGYLTIAIPIIAMGLVKGMDTMATSMASSVTQPAQSATATAGQQVGTGNLSYGVVNHNTAAWNNQYANKSSTAFDYQDPNQSILRSAAGTLTTDGKTGAAYWQANQSSGGFNAATTHGIQQSLTERQQRGVASAFRQLVGNEAAFDRAVREGTRNSNDTTSGEARAWQVLANVKNSFSDSASTGSTHISGTGVNAQAGGNLGVQLGKNKGKHSSTKTENARETEGQTTGGNAGLQLGGAFSYKNQSLDNDEVVYRKLDEAARSHGFENGMDLLNRVGTSKTFESNYGRSDRGTNSIAANLEEARSATVAREKLETFGTQTGLTLANPIIAALLHDKGVDPRTNPQGAVSLMKEYFTDNSHKHTPELTALAMKVLGEGNVDPRALPPPPNWNLETGPVAGSAPVRQFYGAGGERVGAQNNSAHVDGQVSPEDKTGAEQRIADNTKALDDKESLTTKQTMAGLVKGGEAKEKAVDSTDRKTIKND